MRQHSVDLLPDAMRARSQAGLRMGRLITIAVLAFGLLAISATHSRLMLRRLQQQHAAASVEASQVFATESRAAELRRTLDEMKSFAALYERVSLPLNVSAVAATIVNALPESVTLDQLDIDTGARSVSRLPRSRGNETKDQVAPRILSGEVAGFAASDKHIAELVAALEAIPPLADVNLDFSRTRRVNGQDAREFRLSFKIDLDAAYETAPRSAGIAADMKGGTHVQQ